MRYYEPYCKSFFADIFRHPSSEQVKSGPHPLDRGVRDHQNRFDDLHTDSSKLDVQLLGNTATNRFITSKNQDQPQQETRRGVQRSALDCRTVRAQFIFRQFDCGSTVDQNITPYAYEVFCFSLSLDMGALQNFTTADLAHVKAGKKRRNRRVAPPCRNLRLPGSILSTPASCD